MKEFAIIILAGGSSTRMGTSKQLLIIDGQPLLAKIIAQTLLTAAKKIVVVVGANEDQHREAIESFPVDVISNPNWSNGMGSSLKTGLEHVMGTGSFDGVVILACDQPTLSADLIASLVDTHERSGKPIVASRYANTTGVPVFFQAQYFQQLLNLKDEHGAKRILNECRNDVATVEFPSGEIDLDTPDDLNRFLKSESL